jgi:hypothetical protein
MPAGALAGWPRDAADALLRRLGEAAAERPQPVPAPEPAPAEPVIAPAEPAPAPVAAPDAAVPDAAVREASGAAWLLSELERLSTAPQWDGAGDDRAALQAAQGLLLGMSMRVHAALNLAQ